MTPSPLSIVEDTLLSPAGLTGHMLEDVLNKMLGPRIDYADLYLQTAHHESWLLEDSLVKHGNFNIDCGVGLRAI